jgi:hypothetical protein
MRDKKRFSLREERFLRRENAGRIVDRDAVTRRLDAV